jgi:hypothetical protein
MKALPRGVALREPEPAIDTLDRIGPYRQSGCAAGPAGRGGRQARDRQATLWRTSHAGPRHHLAAPASASLQQFGISSGAGSVGLLLNIPIYTGGLVDAKTRERWP